MWFATLSEFQGRSEADSPAPAPPRAEADESMDIGTINPSLDDLDLEGWTLHPRFDYGADSSLSDGVTANAEPGGCDHHEDCEDGNVCTKNKCVMHRCYFKPVDDGLLCDDGNQCTSDPCLAGVCTGTNLPDGTACDDLLTCSGQDSCVAGTCTVPGSVVQKIVFSTTRDKPVPDPGTLPQVNLEIYLMNPDGTDPVRLTNNSVNDSFAALSPDGKGRIVFDSARNSPPGSPPQPRRPVLDEG